MEKQTISVAKAEITIVLNSGSSVLAAANPVFGRYDDLKSASENIDLMSIILSRFSAVSSNRDHRYSKASQSVANPTSLEGQRHRHPEDESGVAVDDAMGITKFHQPRGVSFREGGKEAKDVRLDRLEISISREVCCTVQEARRPHPCAWTGSGFPSAARRVTRTAREAMRQQPCAWTGSSDPLPRGPPMYQRLGTGRRSARGRPRSSGTKRRSFESRRSGGANYSM
ncbi:hypothetical protein ACHAWF_003577 [Thalassiosira exigua]